MITNENLTASKGRAKMLRRRKQQQEDNNYLQDLGDEDNGDEGDNSIIQTMWMGIPCRTKYESSPGHKAVYNCVMPYLTALMMTGPEVLEDPKNEWINFWPKRNPMALDRRMMNVWTKWAIDLGRGEGQPDEDIGPSSTKYEARQVNRISLDEYDKAEQ